VGVLGNCVSESFEYYVLHFSSISAISSTRVYNFYGQFPTFDVQKVPLLLDAFTPNTVLERQSHPFCLSKHSECVVCYAIPGSLCWYGPRFDPFPTTRIKLKYLMGPI